MNEIISKLKEAVALLQALIQKRNAAILFETAERCLGSDASPADEAPDEYGCAETVNEIHRKAFGYPIGGGVSTTKLYLAIKESPYFFAVETPSPGDVIISPTGYGSGAIKNGHVGIVGTGDRIMSNSSSTGTFEYNYTIQSWRKRYSQMGGFPVKFFRRR